MILQLGSGVGITSVVASMFARKVICTDINIGGILDLIRRNLLLNRHFQHKSSLVEVLELDFFADRWSEKLESEIKNVDICLAADGKKIFFIYLKANTRDELIKINIFPYLISQ